MKNSMDGWQVCGGDLDSALAALAHGPGVLVMVECGEGSMPREAGAWMLVTARDTVGTIGGG